MAANVIEPKYPELTPKQNELVHQYVSEGGSHAEIAERMGSDRAWVSKTLKKQQVAEALAKEIAQELGVLSVQALHTVKDLLRSKSDYVRLEAARDLLDRAGFKPIERKQVAVKQNVSFVVDLGDRGSC